MKDKIIVILIVGFSTAINAQSITRDVIASSGIAMQNIEGTCGELMVQNYQSNNSTISQGFHQGDIIITDISEVDFKIDIKIYPNPTISEIFIETTQSKNLNCRMFDLNGRYILEKSLEGSLNKIDVTDLTSGTYFLQITNKSKIIKTYKVLKI